MKNLILIPVLIGLFLTSSVTYGDWVSTTPINKKVPGKLLAKYDTDFARKHPEHGILPYNAPCTDCIELIEKRTPDSREIGRAHV